MARRRKTRRTTTRRRRVSGFGSNDLQVIAGAALGAVGAAFANSKVAAMTKPIDPKIVAAVEVIGGGLLATKAKNPLIKGIGFGVVAAGASGAAKSFGLISGFYSLQAINGMRRVAGLADRRGVMGAQKQIAGANVTAFVKDAQRKGGGVINGLNVNGHSDGTAMAGAGMVN